MTRSPPPNRRSQTYTSPRGSYLTNLLDEDRNAELTLSEALAAAQLEHDRVRETARRVFEQHEQEERHKRLREAEKKEQERLKREAEIAQEEIRLRELRAKSIPKPPPEPEPPKKVDPPKVESPAPAPPPPAAVKKEETPAQPTPPPAAETKPSPAPFANQTTPKPSLFSPKPAEQKPNPFASPSLTNGVSTPSAQVTAPAKAEQKPPPAQQPAPTVVQSKAQATTAVNKQAPRYNAIHGELKQLRKNLMAESKTPGSPLKGQLGNFRREIRVSIGQLTSEKGANRVPVEKIMTALRKALRGEVPSPMISVKTLIAEDRPPVEGAVNNDETLPSLFIYLLNIVAKGIINQFINEGGANPKSADPVGVVAVQIFSANDFLWRGKTLIDIMIAKFYVVCPVLFGLRGNDRTERGRKLLGWRKDGASWITEQSHNDRMTGLGAGFAAISLRDFSKTTKTNPFPPTHYWMALAAIVNTPPEETSNTQYVVLRSIIEGHHQRFLNFYGNAALAALKLALVEFPKKAPQNAPAASSLLGLREVLKVEGLVVS